MARFSPLTAREADWTFAEMRMATQEALRHAATDGDARKILRAHERAMKLVASDPWIVERLFQLESRAA